ncbi:hypothetical protein RUND412_001991 [Rhizina undulata]
MDPAFSTSKVNVTYWDPSNLYPLIAQDLRSRLPLRNLHWKAPSRPLRSINSLHVDLTAYNPLPNPSAPSPGFPPVGLTSGTNHELTRVKSTDSTRTIDSNPPRRSSSRAPPQKERRHQIPGLRKTPYLKIYLLRCDDNDIYKSTSRKLIREWISTHATAGDGMNNHDAFEWLIIHVVLPGTPAAAQPRSSSSDSSGPRWMKGSTTVLEKIRSDFNASTSGNNKKDRVVQIRIPPTHPALGTVNPPVIMGNHIPPVPESPTEAEMAWLDLISKLKGSILTSFDKRVAQYEEDIREKDMQRRLPGWNFCTFFVLKEGLARAFESVGLVEDALVLYDELGFGLEALVRDTSSGRGGEGAVSGRFVDWTREGIWWVEAARKKKRKRLGGESQNEAETEEEAQIVVPEEEDTDTPIDTEKKPYRDLILSNEISVFDFRCYLFARQTTLLLRLGKGNAGIEVPVTVPGTSGTYSLHEAAASAAGGEPAEEDLLRLAEVCKRAIEFVTSVGRVLRTDLWNGYLASSSTPESRDEDVGIVIDNIVSSWIFSVCQQILIQTSTPSLPPGLSSVTGHESMHHVHAHYPRRSSSLPPTPSAEIGNYNQNFKGPITGMDELAAGRGDLMVLARGILESLGRKKGWLGLNGWFFMNDEQEGSGEMVDVDLDGDGEEKPENQWGIEGIRSGVLKKAMEEDDRKAFYRLFERLTFKAMKHYNLAKRTKNAERVTAELAALKFHQKDYVAAAEHLQKITSFYGEQNWGLIETTLLGMYAKCLKEMDRQEEHIRVLLKLLSKSATAEKSRIWRTGGKISEHEVIPAHDESISEALSVGGYVSEILTLSEDIEQEISTPMTHLWSDIAVDLFPRHLQDRDGFVVTLKMRYLLQEKITIHKVQVRLVMTLGQEREIWLESQAPVVMKKGLVKIGVITHSTVPGHYIVDKVVLLTNKLTFTHEFMAKTTAATPVELVASNSAAALTAAKKSRLAFWPSPRNLLVKLELPDETHLGNMRTIDIVLTPGKNHVKTGELRIRPATAGLRLMTADVQILAGGSSIGPREKPGTIPLKEITVEQKIRLRIPYSSEMELTDLALKVEVDYQTELGPFFFADALNIQVALPLAVNVQDVFKSEALFSTFQVSTSAAEIPLRILKAKLEGSKSYEAGSGWGTESGMIVFAKQPASFVYKITRKDTTGVNPEEQQQPLALAIEYRTLEEEVSEAAVKEFKKELAEAGLEEFTHYLVPVMVSRLRQKLAGELEMVGLVEEVELGGWEKFMWEEVLEGIFPGEMGRVEAWLAGFFENHGKIHLIQDPESPELKAITRTIIIPVDVPQLQVIHTVELRITSDTNSKFLEAPYSPPTVTVGQAMPVELIIHHSRAWNNTDGKDGEAMLGDEELEFYFDVLNNIDVWLVSGRKRSHFFAKEGQTHKFPLLLVPTKPGHLLLPTVEVKQFLNNQGSVVPVSCETDYRSAAECVLVLPDVRSTTIRIEGVYNGDGVAEYRNSGIRA